MALSLSPERLKRYKDLAHLFVKYGRSDLVRRSTLAEFFDEEEQVAAAGAPAPSELADDLERLGPTFIKLGQLLSTRADLLPTPYLDALARLQDQVEPFPFEQVEQIVTSELNVRISKAFATFEATPLAAASLGQVHRATLRQGRAVVVKVQRPDIRERVLEDLGVLDDVAGILDRHTEVGKRIGFCRMLDEFRKTLLRELDYRIEAQNLVTIGANLAEFDRIVVPHPSQRRTRPPASSRWTTSAAGRLPRSALLGESMWPATCWPSSCSVRT